MKKLAIVLSIFLVVALTGIGVLFSQKNLAIRDIEKLEARLEDAQNTLDATNQEAKVNADALTSRVDTLSKELGEAKTEALKAEKEASAKADMLNSQVETLTTQLDNAQATALKAETDAKAAAESAAAQIKALIAQLETAKTDALQAEFEAKAKMDMLTAREESLNEQLETAKAAALQAESDAKAAVDSVVVQIEALSTREKELETSRATLMSKEKQLVSMQNQLGQQQDDLIAAQTVLKTKEDEQAALQLQLIGLQEALSNHKVTLDLMQQALDSQKKQIDDFLRLRSDIIKELSKTLSAAALDVKVDTNTGGIMLDDQLMFESGQDSISLPGQAKLYQLMPVYLSVLMRPEYVQFVDEIIIESHTDSKGSYIYNLELSHNRALSVAKFCLELSSLSQQQRNVLTDILTAKGRSYSDRFFYPDSTENMKASQRIEIKFRLKETEMIQRMNAILGNSQPPKSLTPAELNRPQGKSIRRQGHPNFDRVRLREEPGLKTRELLLLSKTDQFFVEYEVNVDGERWYCVVMEDGQNGFIMAHYVDLLP